MWWREIRAQTQNLPLAISLAIPVYLLARCRYIGSLLPHEFWHFCLRSLSPTSTMFQRMRIAKPSKRGRKVNRRMGREDFRSASPFEKGEDSGYFNWIVYGDYEIVEENEHLPYLTASSDERAKFYKPLVRTPHLFLEFARIAEQRGRLDEALDNWIRKYGSLGLSAKGRMDSWSRFQTWVRLRTQIYIQS